MVRWTEPAMGIGIHEIGEWKMQCAPQIAYRLTAKIFYFPSLLHFFLTSCSLVFRKFNFWHFYRMSRERTRFCYQSGLLVRGSVRPMGHSAIWKAIKLFQSRILADRCFRDKWRKVNKEIPSAAAAFIFSSCIGIEQHCRGLFRSKSSADSVCSLSAPSSFSFGRPMLLWAVSSFQWTRFIRVYVKMAQNICCAVNLLGKLLFEIIHVTY